MHKRQDNAAVLFDDRNEVASGNAQHFRFLYFKTIIAVLVFIFVNFVFLSGKMCIFNVIKYWYVYLA